MYVYHIPRKSVLSSIVEPPPFLPSPWGKGKKASGTPPADPSPGGPLYRALPLTFLGSQQPGQVLGMGLGAASASPIHDPLMTHQFCFPAPPAQCLSSCSRRVLMSVLAPKLGGRGRDSVGLLFPFSLPQVQLVSEVELNALRCKYAFCGWH